MKKKVSSLCILSTISVVSAIIFYSHIAYSQVDTSEKKADTCITSSCHSTMGKDIFVHQPVREGECTACHGKSPRHKDRPKRYKFGIIKELDKVCYSCHDKFKIKRFAHTPVVEGECTVCHSPHGSPYKYQLLSQGSELCFTCHDDEIISQQFIHGPADAGGCIVCHEPHSADYEKNLRESPPALCFMCHIDKAEEFRTAKVVHKPAAESCTNCHNPHSALKQFMLWHDPPTLCFKCHKEKKEEVANAGVQHGALMVGKSCLNCHEPHVSNIAKRLSMAPLDLCLSCHDKEVVTPKGRRLTNMKKLLTENKDHHGPIRQKDCSGCHNPHGSSIFRILRGGYPSTFYMSFGIKSYNLCFKCHEKTIVQNPETTKLTDFRNGKVNLHFKHVNKPEKGRTCRACHETHASNHPKHIRETVPFGKWEFFLNFEKTETGGSCAPGCHKLRKYDRVKQVINQ